MKILDFGCGTRKFSPRAIGVDYDELSKPDILCDFDTSHYPFKDNCVDMITSFEVIEHLKHPSLFIKEISRILKRGGLLIIATNNRNSLINRIFKTYEVHSHISLQTSESLENLISKHLVIVQRLSLSYNKQDRTDLLFKICSPFREFVNNILPESLRERTIIVAQKSWLFKEFLKGSSDYQGSEGK